MANGSSLDDLLLGDGVHGLEEQNFDPTWLDTLLPPDDPPEAPAPQETNTLGALLAYSCEVESVENVVTLLKQGANPNVSFHNGKTAMEWATIKQNNLIIEHLLRHGADTADTVSHDQRRWTTPTCPAPPPPAATQSPPQRTPPPQSSASSSAIDESWSIPARTSLSSIKRPVATPEKRLDSIRGLYNYERRPTDPRDKSKPSKDTATPSRSPHVSSGTSSQPSAPSRPSWPPSPTTTRDARPKSVHRSISRARPVSPDPERHPTLFRSKSRPRSPSVPTTPFSRRLRSHSHARQLSPDPESGLPRTVPYHPSMDMCMLYVGNLPRDATDADVRRFFARCGTIRYFRRGVQPQWGHITFATAEEGVEALLLDGDTFMGSELKIRFGDRCNKDMIADIEKKMRKLRRKKRESSPDGRRGRSRERRSKRRVSPDRWEHDLYQDDDRDRPTKRREASSRHDSRTDSRHKRGGDRSRSRHRGNATASRDRSKSRYRDKSEPRRSHQDSRHRSKSHYRASSDDVPKDRARERSHARPHRPVERTDNRSKPHRPVERTDDRSKSHYRPRDSENNSAAANREGRAQRSAPPDSRRSKSVSHRSHAPSRSKSVSRPPPSRSKSVHRQDVVDLSMSSPEDGDEPTYSRRPRQSVPRPILRSATDLPQGDLRHELNQRGDTRSRSKSVAPTFGHMQRHRSMSQHPQRNASRPRSTTDESHDRPGYYGATSPPRQSPPRREAAAYHHAADGATKRPRPPSSNADDFAIPKRPRSSSTAPAHPSTGFQVRVSNVSKRANSDALRRMFGICGPLENFHRDVSSSGVPQSVVHVAFTFREALKKALELDGLELCGRPIRVEVSDG